MVGSGPNWEESIGSQRQNQFLNLERMRDRKISVHTTHTGGSQSLGGSHLSHEENTRSMQLEINRLRRRLHREQHRETPSSSDPSSKDDNDNSYRPKSKTPPSESFSCDQDHHYRRRREILSRQGLGNNAIGRALNQISKSPFTRRIKDGKLPRQFTQPTFIMYNDKTDPVEHVSHFNQRMAVHSRNKILMCKVFPSSLGPMAMR